MNNPQEVKEPKYKKTININKTLPNSFRDVKDEIPIWQAFIISVVAHPATLVAIWLMSLGLSFLGLKFDFAKPNLPPKDIEFVIVTKEAEPINKNTPYRSDKNSRAGGIHDKKRKVSEPSPAPAPKPAKSATKKAGAAPKPKTVAKPTPLKQLTQALAPQKPTPTAAPKLTQKPVGLPSNDVPKPQMPKLATNPTSPFSVAVPKSNLPEGPVPSTSSGTAKSGGQYGGSQTGTGRGSDMPAPQFSTGKGAGGSGSGTGAKGGTGSGGPGTGGNGLGGYGTGGLGNPGPGNPSGPPGIDALKQADWGPYMRELERRIKRNWNPPKGDASKRVVILFTIGRDGRLIAMKTLKSSGQPASDQAAKSAIQLTAPFKSLPPEFKGDRIDIEFTFDYNVLGASYR